MSTEFMLSMNTNLKTMRLQNAVQQRLASGDTTTKRDLTTLAPTETTTEDDSRLEQIHAKLQYGGKLTEKERQYLKNKDPKAYADLVQEEEEQKTYERALRTCRTKEEAQYLKLGRITRSLSNIKAAEKNSDLSKEDKLKVASRELRAINHAIKTTAEYLRSGKCKTNSLRTHSNADTLRTLLQEHIDRLISRSNDKSSARYDTFTSSTRTFDEIQDDAVRCVKKLYEDIQQSLQNDTEQSDT